eukprot:jgi/Chrzof1/367/Cz01g13100.t1
MPQNIAFHETSGSQPARLWSTGTHSPETQDAGRRAARPSDTDGSIEELKLPDPQQGALPLFHASEYDAMQQAADAGAEELRSATARAAWKRWAMQPVNVNMVVELAWFTCAVVFKPDDPKSQAVQTHVVEKFSNHYVTVLLSKHGELGDTYSRLWMDAVAKATATLLRCAFPASADQFGPQLVATLKHQLRLWATGLLPSDAHMATLAATNHNTSRSGQRQSGSLAADNGAGDHRANDVSDDDTDDGDDRFTAHAAVSGTFYNVKTGLLMSHHLSSHHVTPQQLWRGRHVYRQGCYMPQTQASPSDGQELAAGTDACGSSPPSFRQRAAACLSNAQQATSAYEAMREANKKAKVEMKHALQQDRRAIQKQRHKASSLPIDERQAMSNSIAGWMDADTYNACSPVLASTTDASCKAQRKRLELDMRSLDLKLAGAFNPTAHSKSLDLAASMHVNQGRQATPSTFTPSRQGIRDKGVTGKYGFGGVGALADCTALSSPPTAPARIMRAARAAVRDAKIVSTVGSTTIRQSKDGRTEQ